MTILAAEKICTACLALKPRGDFYLRKKGGYLVATKCKVCMVVVVRNARAKRRDRVRHLEDAQLRQNTPD